MRITPLIVALLLCRDLGVAQSRPVPPTAANAAYRVAGTVVNNNGGHSLAQARISLTDARNPQITASTFSDDEGHFVFEKVAAGKYALLGAKRGFVSANYDEHGQYSTAIVTGAGLDTENLILRLPPVAVISGKVLDESGEPVRQANVTLYWENNQLGVARVRPFRQVATDDRGTFEITPLPAGTYFLSARAVPWYAIHPATARSQESGEEQPAAFVDQTLDVAYPTTYYADVDDYESATAIPIRGGDHPDIEIHLNPVAALHVLFHLPEDAERHGMIPTLQQPSFDGMERVEGAFPREVSPGVYELTGIAAGRYTVRTPSEGSGPEWSEVDLTSNGQELDTSSSQATASVKASVKIPGETILPEELTVVLRNERGRTAAWSQVDEKGTLEFSNVTPGKYEVWAGARDKPYSVLRISHDGATTSGHTLSVPPGSTMSAVFTLVAGSSDVEGLARKDGKPVAGAMIVLVPKNPRSNRELFRRDQSDLDGSFRLRDVIPGSYTVVAIADGWDLDWAQPGVIAHYARRGQSIEVNGGSGVVNLKSAVEVQPR
jgi:hypothetical protein